MAITFNSNIQALKSVRAVSDSTTSLSKTFERLSSGQRINKSADDSAGLAVATGLQNQSKVYRRGLLNINDGVSALEQANSTYDGVTTLLTRMSELAAQSANGSLSTSQRSALDAEYQQLDSEIRRLTKETKFNNIELANGSAASRSATSVNSSITASPSSVSADGRYITFVASSKVQQYDTVTGQITELTAALSGSVTAIASGSGSLVAFTSTSNLTGQNASNKSQVFMYDKSTGSTRQITSYSSTPSLTLNEFSLNGDTLVYTNSEFFSYYVHAYRSSTNTISALASTVDPIDEYAVSADGRFVAVRGDIASTGQRELYRADLQATSKTLVQASDFYSLLGSDLFDTNDIAIDNNGKIIFSFSGDLTGGNPNEYNQIYSISSIMGTVSQLTNGTSGANYQFALSNDGGTLNFISSSNYGQNSSNKVNLFSLDLTNNQVTQRTNYTDNTLLAATTSGKLSADGNSIFYQSSGLKSIDLSPEKYALSIEAGGGTFGNVLAQISAINGTLRGLGSSYINTAGAARAALDTVTKNLESLGAARGTVGANVSRLESAYRSLSAKWQETTAAASRITDIDTAQEVANLTSQSIRRDTATAILAQSKLVPQIALDLLNSAVGSNNLSYA